MNIILIVIKRKAKMEGSKKYLAKMICDDDINNLYFFSFRFFLVLFPKKIIK